MYLPSMDLKRIITTLLLSISLLSFSQSEVKVQIQLLTSDLIGEVNLEQESFFNWATEVKETIHTTLSTENGDKEVLTSITLHKHKKPSFDIGARPSMDKKVLGELKARLQRTEAPNTLFTDYSFALVASINAGIKNDQLPFVPEVQAPIIKRIEAFKALSLIDKKIELQAWVKQEVLPITGVFLSKTDSKMESTHRLGRIVNNNEYLKDSTKNITDKNSDYWKATVEMTQGDQLIPFTKVLMHIAHSEFDLATRWLEMIELFVQKQTLPAVFLKELKTKMDLLNEDLNSEISKGIALHDQSKYKKAIQHYDNLLASFPCSAWLLYEKYYSSVGDEQDLDVMKSIWESYEKRVFECDPLYHIDPHSSNGKEGYLQFKRQEIRTLFQSNEQMEQDFIKYADIALDLGAYAEAAQVYWLIMSYFPPETYDNRNFLAHFLYCTRLLGDERTLLNFDMDFKTEFRAIIDERDQIMKKSPIYQVFKNKEND